MASCDKKNGAACCFSGPDTCEEPVFTVQPTSSTPRRNFLLKQEQTTINFKVNGKEVVVNVADVTPSTALATFLRGDLHLPGTKIFCFQGGCGVCIVTANIPVKDGRKIVSVNSCLAPLLSCDGWEITTAEGLGNRIDGLHPVQASLAEFSGTQCGICSPGMVSQMNSLLESNPNATMKDVEGILDGNICRCTGYRPIFDAFKALASDAPAHLRKKLADIEDICKTNKGGCCKNNGAKSSCSGGGLSRKKPIAQYPTGQGQWFAPSNLEDMVAILQQIPAEQTCRFVGGNTGRGVYGAGSFDNYIDVRKVPELAEYTVSPILQIGGAATLTETITIFESVATNFPATYAHCKAMADHLRKTANTSVRNAGTIAGNLMLKHAHPEFPSDLFTMFEAAGAAVVIRSTTGEQVVSPLEFLAADMTKKFIWKIEFPALGADYRYASYKITPRRENAHAYVNGGFRAKVDAAFTVLEQPTLVYGGISAEFNRASNTEQFLVGKSLNDGAVLQEALSILRSEVVPTPDYVLASEEYRKHLTQALFYKFVISALGTSADPKLQSAATQISRGISSGKQTYSTDPSLYPVNQALPKIEGQSQCSGEAEYINDIPTFPNELTGSFVLSTQANCELDIVDASAALAIPGVLAFYDYTSIPGTNQANIYSAPEYIFSEGPVAYAGQPIGFIVAESSAIARRAVGAVKVTYKNIKKPVLTIREALNDPARIIKSDKSQAKPVPKQLLQGRQVRQISGEFEIGDQIHFSMENQACIVKPVEDKQLEIYSASQWMDNVHITVASALNIPEAAIEVKVRRMGGAYGGKISPPSHVAAAAALAAYKLHKPVRTVLDMRTNFEFVGKRWPYLIKYNAGVTPEGKLVYVSILFYTDAGYNNNESEGFEAVRFAKSCYQADFWSLETADVITNKAPNRACRAPGTTQGIAAIETVMEHLATALGMDPLQFRLMNMIETSQSIPNPLPGAMIPELLTSSAYEARVQEIQAFNQANAWKKRGISVVPVLYPFLCHFGVTYYFQLSVYAEDGTIAISHGGHEMGQGINTKVVQTVAKTLGVPVDLIHQKPANTFNSPNSIVSGGSATTDLICSAAIIACEDLKARMKVIGDTMDNPTWLQLVKACYRKGVDITAKHMGYGSRDAPNNYDIWSAVVTEVEVDVLTGEKNVRRVDIIEDTGTSLNPVVDIGQIEGAFVMVLGLWLTEELKFHPDTGRLLTADTWEYKPPSSGDIPEDFRVTLFNNGVTPGGVFGAKAIGEPGCMFGISAVLAIRQALNAVKQELGQDPKEWYNLFGPATTERVQLTSGVVPENFFL